MENNIDNILITDIPIEKKKDYYIFNCSNFCGNCLFMFCVIFTM